MEERRRRKNRKTALASEEPRCAVHSLPDDLLRLILLRLDSPVCLLRAACACKRWRRVVATDGGADADAGRAFLRLASSLHAPVILGHYHNYDISPGDHCFVPSSPATATTIDESRFSLDFLPGEDSSWNVADCHGGLVLLRDTETSDLIVCDPLTRRYQGICRPPEPELPDQQAARRFADDSCFPDVFLLDGDDGDHISVSNFRVLYWSDDDFNQRSRAYVFITAAAAAGGGDWLLLRQSELDYSYRYDKVGRVAGRVGDGSPYLGFETGSVVALDSVSLEFSKVDLPIRVKKKPRFSVQKRQISRFAVVHGSAFASPRTTTARIVHVRGGELELFRRVRGSGEWMLEHSIPCLQAASCGLPGYYAYNWWMAVDVTAGDSTGLAVVTVRLSSIRTWRFAMDVNTMELQVLPDEVARRGGEDFRDTFTYTLPWPQFLRACA